MSRSALLGAFVFVVAGLSGCATPAKVVYSDKSTAVIAVPEDSNTWPFYYHDEAMRVAAERLDQPIFAGSKRVKVGEQTTNTQDMTRRDLGGADKPKVGEVVSATNRTSTSDSYEYHLEFRSQKPEMKMTIDKGPVPELAGAPPMAGAPNLPPPPAYVPTPSPIRPVTGLDSRGERMSPANDILTPMNPTPSTNLPSTNLTVPGGR